MAHSIQKSILHLQSLQEELQQAQRTLERVKNLDEMTLPDFHVETDHQDEVRALLLALCKLEEELRQCHLDGDLALLQKTETEMIHFKNQVLQTSDAESVVGNPPSSLKAVHVSALVRTITELAFEAPAKFSMALQAHKHLVFPQDVVKMSRDGPVRVNDQNVKNWKFYGNIKPFPEHLKKKYRCEGVTFTKAGFPDFRPFAHMVCQLEQFSERSRYHDDKRADEACGINQQYRKERALTWHHTEDLTHMYLIPEDVHDFARHTGGKAISDGIYKKVNSQNSYHMLKEAYLNSFTELYGKFQQPASS